MNRDHQRICPRCGTSPLADDVRCWNCDYPLPKVGDSTPPAAPVEPPDKWQFAQELMLDRRNIQAGDECDRCGGWGVTTYGNTATWLGGIGGSTITDDVCDRCWGSGNRHKPWPSRRASHPPEARHQQALETAIAGCIEKAAAEREQWRNEFHRQRERIATLEADLARVTQERDEARKKCADNERGYESLIRRYEHSVSAETARADAAEARCAALTEAIEKALGFHQVTHTHAILSAALQSTRPQESRTDGHSEPGDAGAAARASREGGPRPDDGRPTDRGENGGAAGREDDHSATGLVVATRPQEQP